MAIIRKYEIRKKEILRHDHHLSLLPKSSQVGHSGFGRFRRFWWVDHCLELVIADPPVSVLIVVIIMVMTYMIFVADDLDIVCGKQIYFS